jgi:hypothetical protein
MFLPFLPYAAGYPVLIGLFGLTSLLRPDAALTAFAFMQPSFILIRYKDPSSVLIAGLRLELLAVFACCLVVRYSYLATNSQAGFPCLLSPLRRDVAWQALCVYVVWAIVVILIHWISVEYAFLAFREHVAIFVLYPATILLLHEFRGLDAKLLSAMFYGGMIPAIVSLLAYFSVIELFTPVLLTTGDYIEQRVVLGLKLPRLNPVLGPGPAGGGVYYSALFCLGLVRLLQMRKLRALRFVDMVVSLLFALCAVLTLSYSIIIVFILVVYTWITVSRLSKVQKAMILTAAAVLWGVLFTTGFISVHRPHEYSPLSMYNYMVLVGGRGLLAISNHLTTWNAFVGSGFDICSRGFAGVAYPRQVTWDLGWVSVFLYTGIVGFAMLVLFVKEIVRRLLAVNRFVHSEGRHIFLAAATIFVSLFGYAHAPAITVWPMDVNFLIAVAIIADIYLRVSLPARTSFVSDRPSWSGTGGDTAR